MRNAIPFLSCYNDINSVKKISFYHEEELERE